MQRKKNVVMLSLPGSDDVAMVLGMQYHVAEEKEPSVGPGETEGNHPKKASFLPENSSKYLQTFEVQWGVSVEGTS